MEHNPEKLDWENEDAYTEDFLIPIPDEKVYSLYKEDFGFEEGDLKDKTVLDIGGSSVP